MNSTTKLKIVEEEAHPVAQSVRPLAELFLEKLFIPRSPKAATWPSACKIAGVWAPDDF